MVEMFEPGRRYLGFALSDGGLLRTSPWFGNCRLGRRWWIPFQHERPVGLVDGLFRVVRARSSHGDAKP